MGPLTDLSETTGVLRLLPGVDIPFAAMVAAVRRMVYGWVGLFGPRVLNEACRDVKRLGDRRGDGESGPLDALHGGRIDVVSRQPVAVGDLTVRDVMTEVRRPTTCRLGPISPGGREPPAMTRRPSGTESSDPHLRRRRSGHRMFGCLPGVVSFVVDTGHQSFRRCLAPAIRDAHARR